MWGQALRGQFSDLADFVAVFGLSRFRCHFRTLPNVPTWSTYFWSRYRRGVFCGKATDMGYKSSEPTHVEYLFLDTVPTWSICRMATDMEYTSPVNLPTWRISTKATHMENVCQSIISTKSVKVYKVQWTYRHGVLLFLVTLPTWGISSKATRMWTCY